MSNQNVLLMMLPFWPPLIPPMGMACLKSYLQTHDYRVKTIDTNIDPRFRKTYDTYFQILQRTIPKQKQGNFYNLGIDVLQNHMTAHFRLTETESYSREQYLGLIEEIIRQNFFCDVEKDVLEQLDREVGEFYRQLTDYIEQLLELEKPDVFGVSIYKGNFGASLFTLKSVRLRQPQVMTVMGGGIFSDQLAVGSPNFNYFMGQTPYIDKVVVGEGELLFLKLLKGELSSQQKVFTQKDIQGEIMDIGTARLPDFSDFDTCHYTQMASYTSRSCPFQCGFCAETVNWGKFRKKSALQVADELRQLQKTYRSQLFLMSDSLLNPIISDLSRQLYQSEPAIYWDGYLRADRHVCEEDNAYLWRRGGFYRARLGIESGSSRILELMDKRITPSQIKSALYNLSQAGIKTSTYWVIGYPGETEEDFQQTLDLIEAVKENIYEAECNPFRFYLTGQVQSDHWSQGSRSRTLYPESARELLMIQTYVIDDEALPRDLLYQRVNRFVTHCKRMGIPNPYSGMDIHKADERWKQLHTNAVPPLAQFRDPANYTEECKTIEKALLAKNTVEETGDFDF